MAKKHIAGVTPGVVVIVDGSRLDANRLADIKEQLRIKGRA